MQISAIKNNFISNYPKHSCEKQGMTSPISKTELPAFADAKSLANINFKARIHACAKNRNWDGVQAELNKGVDINSKDESGNTALDWACYENDIDTIEKLLSHPDIDVNSRDNERHTALIETMRHKHPDAANKILEHPDVDVNAKDKDGNSALDWASYYGLVSGVEKLLTHPDIDVNIQDNCGNTPLIEALRMGNISVAKKILEHPDVDLTLKNNKGQDAFSFADTPIRDLLSAYQRGVDNRKNVMESLRLPSVDINKLSPEENIWNEEQIGKKFTALVKTKKFDDAEKMLEATPLINLDGDENQILIDVCSTGNYKFARKVFDYQDKQAEMRADYDIRRKEFLESKIQTLSYEELKENLVALNTEDGFKVLVSKEEFNPNDMAEKNSLFDIACKLDSDGSIVKGILSKYEDVDTKNARRFASKDIRPLIADYETKGKYQILFDNIKRNMANPETKEIAVEKIKNFINSEEFKPDITDSLGNTALHIVAAMPDDSARGLIQKLVDKGVDIDAPNITNQTPLISAIKAMRIAQNDEDKTNLLSNIKFLLDKDAEVDIKDNNGQTAFHHACASNSPALLTLVLAKEPNILAKDSLGHRGNFYLSNPKMKEIYDSYVNN